MAELFDVVVVRRSLTVAQAAGGRHRDRSILSRLVTGLDRATADAWARSFNSAERERPYGVRAEVRPQPPQPSGAALQIALSTPAPLERSA